MPAHGLRSKAKGELDKRVRDDRQEKTKWAGTT